MDVSDGRAKGGGLTLVDLRRERRIACDRDISVLPHIPSGGWDFTAVRLVDCSTHGLGIIAPEAMSPGERFVVKLELDKVLLAHYRVRHCSHIGRRQFRIGAEPIELVGPPGFMFDMLLSAENQPIPAPLDGQR